MADRLIKVQGQGSATQPPDHVAISFFIRVKHAQYQEALRLLEEKYSAVEEHAVKAKISPEQLTTIKFAVDTAYVTKNKQQVFDGYQASHSLRLEIPWDKEGLALILQELSNITGGVEFHLSFFVKDPIALRNTALERAVSLARENARILANAAGVQLGEVVLIEYGWEEFRFKADFELSARNAMAAPRINPREIEHSESVTMTWLISG